MNLIAIVVWKNCIEIAVEVRRSGYSIQAIAVDITGVLLSN